MKQILRRNMKKNDLCLFFILLLFFLAAGYHGPILESDSNSYIIMNHSREPVYTLFLAFFRVLFGSKVSLYVVCIIQELLAAFTITLFVHRIAEIFHFNLCAKYLSAFLLTVPFWIDLIFYTPIGTRANRILSEGLMLPLFYLFLYFFVRAIMELRLSQFGFALIVFVLSVNCRSQMFVLFPILFIGFVYLAVKTKKWVKGIIYFIIAGCMTILVSKAYSFFLTGSAEGSNMNKLTMLANLLYASQESDVVQFKDTDMALIFEDLYEQMAENGTNCHFVTGLTENADNLHRSHDTIKYIYMMNTITAYQEKSGRFTEVQHNYNYEEIIEHLYNGLLFANIPQWLWNCFCSSYKGFIRSIFVAKDSVLSFCALYCALAYLVFIILLILNRHKKSFLLGMTILIFIFANVGGVSLTIFDLFRYFIYSQGVFYVAFLCLFSEASLFKRLLTRKATE